MDKIHLLSLSISQLNELIQLIGEPAYRSKQIWQAVYCQKSSAIQEMTALSSSLRVKLEETCTLSVLQPSAEARSTDKQTVKQLFITPDGNKLETVWMKYNERDTLCISTQSGCAMGCTFCATGQMGFSRNLTAGEIVEQILFFERKLNLIERKVTNIVFMGMGEPFHNYEEVMKAIQILGDGNGYNLGSRRMTISTVGLIPQIKRFSAERSQVNLAISLHAIDDPTRSKMMPVNRKYPIDDLLAACKEYVDNTHRRISFEWALIEGVNDDIATAKKLAIRLKGILCHVNLIQLNPTRYFAGRGSNKTRALEFMHTLQEAGIPVSIRLRRGIDINAGCGQLASSQ
jgi:23S rRNA (adenine2503-C2)-methyltransferase